MVGQIVDVLQDLHSTGFHVKCAKGFDRDALLSILGGVRQARTEGMSLNLARKTFTATARRRAKDMGIDL